MKRIKFTLLVLFIVSCVHLSAQKPIKVTEDSLVFGKTKMPGLVVTIPEVEYERTHRSWIKRLQQGTKSKVTEEFNQMSIFGSNIKDISSDPINVYSILENRDTIMLLRVAFEIKKDQYVQSNTGGGTQSKAIMFLKQFAKEQYISLVEDQVSAENKKLRDLNGELKSMQNEKSRLEKSIISNNKQITEEKDDILIWNNEITQLSPRIISAHDSLSLMQEGDSKDKKNSYVRDLEKRKKKLLNSVENSEKRVARANSEIDQAKLALPKNESEQSIYMDKISKQEFVVQAFKDKLKRVQGY
jgi:hypothetical protein